MSVFVCFFAFFGAKIRPAAAGTGELGWDLRDQTQTAPLSRCNSEAAALRSVATVLSSGRSGFRGTGRTPIQHWYNVILTTVLLTVLKW